MPKILLQNTTLQPYEFTESHDVVCMRRGTCSCLVTRVVGPKGKSVSKRLARSFRVGAKGTSTVTSMPVDREVLHEQHIASLVAAGKLLVLDAPAEASEPVKES